jgi:16S rRNA (adenine1518-N6/adenine1519-N6)-dimethyltransferase
LSPLPPLRDVIARHGLSASKVLGQNFLFDEQLLDRIARVPGPLDGARVLEVGPGPGGLTRALLRAGACVTAIERDARCLPALAELSDWAPGRLRVIEGDALKIDGEAELGGPGHIVANLPYNVGTALLVGWLTSGAWPPWWRSLTLMFQKEVAERIVAVPDTDAYGRRAAARPVAGVRADRDARPPLRLYPAAQGDERGRAYRACRAAARRTGRDTRTPDRRRVRPAP